MATKHEVKTLIGKMVEAVENVGTLLGVDDGAGNAARAEIAMFMMYLSASDGEIQWSEASMISELCDLNLTPQSLGQFIRDNNIYSVEFERKVPVTLKMMVAADNKMREVDSGDDLPDIAGLIIETYKLAAQMLLEADDDIDDNEESDYQIYLDMLEDYVNKNSNRRKQTISGFAKNTGGVSAPTKSGVSAPKKKV